MQGWCLVPETLICSADANSYVISTSPQDSSPALPSACVTYHQGVLSSPPFLHSAEALTCILMSDTKPQIQEAQTTSSKINAKKPHKSDQTKTNHYTYTYHFKLQKRQRKNSERSLSKKIPYLQNNKDKNHIQLLLRNHVNKKKTVKYLKYWEKKKH